MPTNRLVEKEKVVTYAGALLDAANQMGGQEGVLEIRDELEQIVRIMRQSIDLTEALSFQDSSIRRLPTRQFAEASCMPSRPVSLLNVT